MIPAEPHHDRRALRLISGLSGIIGVILPTLMVFLALQQSPWFQWNVNPLSDIGVHNAAPLFNGSLILGGSLFLIFALTLHSVLTKGRWSNAATICLSLGSISLILIGVFTLNDPILHVIFANGFFILPPIGFLLFGYGTQDTLFRRFSLLAGAAALLAIYLSPILLTSINLGFAIPELLETIIMELWVLVLSIQLLRNHLPTMRT
jgi:hypothetical membrane protein